ncbi:uncharacterized protein LOC131614003 [Vicia villosa]|uniref:uncharacterized protein LOC131614003 n=1 Tax=Vicia villosa TaxID=3911 RepID=UPI00273C3922|nr:uncharacterized protein LOC131614003 [Vicia villosa]
MKKPAYVDRPAPPPLCGKCNGRHHGECPGTQRRCFRCGSPDHFAKKCPVSETPEKKNGRVYTLDARKAKGNANLVAKSLVPTPMIISSTTDDVVEAQKICKDCSVTFNGQNFVIVLICLPLKKIDVVLGMDWLSANSVYISCKEKAIFIPAEETTSMDSIGNRIEGTVNMVNYLFAPEKSFILILTTDSEDKKSVSEIPVVCEFPNVFPEDVTSLSPEREV